MTAGRARDGCGPGTVRTSALILRQSSAARGRGDRHACGAEQDQRCRYGALASTVYAALRPWARGVAESFAKLDLSRNRDREHVPLAPRRGSGGARTGTAGPVPLPGQDLVRLPAAGQSISHRRAVQLRHERLRVADQELLTNQSCLIREPWGRADWEVNNVPERVWLGTWHGDRFERSPTAASRPAPRRSAASSSLGSWPTVVTKSRPIRDTRATRHDVSAGERRVHDRP
jgi:hypothetical protein